MTRHENIPGFQAGKEVERELLGVVREAKEKERKGLIRERKAISAFEDAVFDVKERRIQNPINPERPFANFVRFKISDSLSLKNDKDLKFYTALSSDPREETVLDHDFGIDAFFELEEKEKEPVLVTIDLTLKAFKENPKASIIFRIPEDFPIQARFEKNQIKGLTKSEWQTFNGITDELAQEIADKFKKLKLL